MGTQFTPESVKNYWEQRVQVMTEFLHHQHAKADQAQNKPETIHWKAYVISDDNKVDAFLRKSFLNKQLVWDPANEGKRQKLSNAEVLELWGKGAIQFTSDEHKSAFVEDLVELLHAEDEKRHRRAAFIQGLKITGLVAAGVGLALGIMGLLHYQKSKS